jgi:hypothetical protein
MSSKSEAQRLASCKLCKVNRKVSQKYDGQPLILPVVYQCNITNSLQDVS